MADSESKEVSENVTENKNATSAKEEDTSDSVEVQDSDSTKKDQEIVHSKVDNTEDISEQKGEQGAVEQENEDVTQKENVAMQSQDMPVQTKSGENSEEKTTGKEDENESRTESYPSLVVPQCSKDDQSTSESVNKQSRTSTKGESDVIGRFFVLNVMKLLRTLFKAFNYCKLAVSYIRKEIISCQTLTLCLELFQFVTENFFFVLVYFSVFFDTCLQIQGKLIEQKCINTSILPKYNSY